MKATTPFRQASRVAALGALALTAACSSDPGLIAGPDASRITPRPNFDITPTPALVVISSDATTGFVPFLANNSGRGSSEFWDNYSADDPDPPTVAGCNAGFFAAGTMRADCLFQASAPASYNNRGGYSQYFSGGPGNDDAAPFMFNGGETYNLKLEGSWAGGISGIGYFYRNDAGQPVFNEIPGFGAKTINATFQITPAMTGGRNWGFYIREPNNFPTQPGSCATDTNCSDATGGYAAFPYQQFALFLNAAGTKYLVAAEDNQLELLPNGPRRDSDYNDYLISVTPLARAGGQGCSPGFWKNTSAANWAKAGYSPTTQFSAVFENAFPGLTLQQVLGLNGGGLNALGRQTVSALLNGGAIGNNYEYSQASVISKFNAAYPGTASSYETLKNDFERYIDVDGRICPLNNGRN